MIYQAYILFGVLAITLALFIWGRWRYDIVALLALLVLVILGIIPTTAAFTGFSNPAVITVACVMVITQVITDSGIVNHAVRKLTPITSNTVIHIGLFAIITAALSAFMNNVGALALMMPIAIHTALHNKLPPSLILMPLAFASVLGGLITVIGTPPNLLISTYREQVTGHAFSMFDFSPVGLSIAVVAIIFITLLGWRLLPKDRKGTSQINELFKIQDYVSEVQIPEHSPLVGKSRIEVEQLIDEDYTIIGLIRAKQKHIVIPAHEIFQAGDILIVEAAHDDLQFLLDKGKLELVGDSSAERFSEGDISLIEVVVPPGARVEGRSWQQMQIRSRLRINLLAIARQGKAFQKRLAQVKLTAGDVLLLQGEASTLTENAVNLGLLPLAERGVKLSTKRKALAPIGIFVFAIVLAALQILPVAIAFAGTILAFILFNLTSTRQLYTSINWSIIVLLAAMIPIGTALQATGGTELIAQAALSLATYTSPVVIMILLLIITMTLSDIMNNAATAVVMAPIAVTIAQSLNVSIDPFLMAVAIGASSSFLTPIGHQNNTLVMGPGGYKFYDYIRLGLPVELIVLAVGIPALLWFWPI